MRRDDAYLLDIHLAVRDISRFVAGMSLAEFKANRSLSSDRHCAALGQRYHADPADREDHDREIP